MFDAKLKHSGVRVRDLGVCFKYIVLYACHMVYSTEHVVYRQCRLTSIQQFELRA